MSTKKKQKDVKPNCLHCIYCANNGHCSKQYKSERSQIVFCTEFTK